MLWEWTLDLTYPMFQRHLKGHKRRSKLRLKWSAWRTVSESCICNKHIGVVSGKRDTDLRCIEDWADARGLEVKEGNERRFQLKLCRTSVIHLNTSSSELDDDASFPTKNSTDKSSCGAVVVGIPHRSYKQKVKISENKIGCCTAKENSILRQDR